MIWGMVKEPQDQNKAVDDGIKNVVQAEPAEKTSLKMIITRYGLPQPGIGHTNSIDLLA